MELPARCVSTLGASQIILGMPSLTYHEPTMSLYELPKPEHKGHEDSKSTQDTLCTQHLAGSKQSLCFLEHDVLCILAIGCYHT